MIEDVVLKGFFSEFCERYDLLESGATSGPDYTLAFEQFAHHTVMSRLYGNEVSFPDVSTGDAHGIDGIALIVNSQFIESTQALDDLSAASVDAKFVITQVKSSDSFNEGDFLKFVTAAKAFLVGDTSIPMNDEMRAFADLRKRLVARRDMSSAPSCDMYFIYTGTFASNIRIAKEIADMRTFLVEERCYLSELSVTIIDRERLKEWYKIVARSSKKEIELRLRTELPSAIDGVKVAYLGFLPATELLKLVSDPEGELEQKIFYENVRAYLGDTTTNREIANTIRAENGLSQEWFALLHNGVTVVASEISQIGPRLTLTDIQIVNGCQSSNILYALRDQISDDLYIPVRIIVTNKADLIDWIIRGTNRQNEVLDEVLIATNAFQKELETFYEAYGKDCPIRPGLLYERRAHQYAHQHISFPDSRPVNIPTQIKSFIGMFSGEPHLAHHYYGMLLKWSEVAQNNDPILFRAAHHDKYIAYYTSALFHDQLDRLWNNKRLAAHLRIFRFHVLDVLRKMLFGTDLSSLMKLTHSKVQDRCAKAIDFWSDGSSALSTVKSILNSIDEAYSADGTYNTRQNAAQSERFTRALERSRPKDVVVAQTMELDESINQYSLPTRSTGTVFRSGPDFGFIRDSKGQDVFLHRSVVSSGKVPAVGTYVHFTAVSGPKGFRALDVEISASS